MYYTMSKDTETQPYRNFKEFLDTIIKMPENLKNRLANEFERRRLEDKPLFGSKKDDEDTSIFGSKEKKEEEEEEVKEDKSFFDRIFSKEQTDELIKFFSEPNAAPLKKCQIRPW